MDYLVVMGGRSGGVGNLFQDILFYNLATRNWETYPTKIHLPEPMANIQAVVALQLDDQVSIAQTFYEQLFQIKVFCPAFF